MFRERRFAAVFFDDRDDLVFDELPRRLSHQLFFVIQLRIKINEVDSAISSHAALLVSGRLDPAEPTRAEVDGALSVWPLVKNSQGNDLAAGMVP
jgi:hypothetical protein